jgi:hypothetical protein
MASDKDLETIKKGLAFIGRMVQRESLSYEDMDEIGREVQHMRAALESHELSLMPEIEDALAA